MCSTRLTEGGGTQNPQQRVANLQCSPKRNPNSSQKLPEPIHPTFIPRSYLEIGQPATAKRVGASSRAKSGSVDKLRVLTFSSLRKSAVSSSRFKK